MENHVVLPAIVDWRFALFECFLIIVVFLLDAFVSIGLFSIDFVTFCVHLGLLER